MKRVLLNSLLIVRRSVQVKARPSDILTVEFDEIEGAQYVGVVVKPMAECVEYREAGFVDHDCLAVDDTGTDRQARDRIDDLRKARRES